MALTTKHQVLAWDLVEELEDEIHKGIYFRLSKIYDETFLRSILRRVKDAYENGRIGKKDRGRYFMGILKKELVKHESNIKYYSRRRPDTAKRSRSRKRSKKS